MNTVYREHYRLPLKPTFDVYVGHVPQSIEEDKLFGVFSKFGDIAHIICRYGGKGPLGYAIVKFKHKKDCDRVLKEIDQITVDGNVMEVRHAIKNQNFENGNESHGKMALFDPPPSPMYPMRNMNYAEQHQHPPPDPSTSAMYNIRNINYAEQHQPPPPVSESSYLHNPQPFDKNEQLPVMIEVMCTSVENAVTFYGCPIFRCEELHNLSIKLNTICPNLMCLLRKPMENQMYGALYKEDMSWYRCVVVQSTVAAKPGMCIVRYVDYGNFDEIHYNKLVELPEGIRRISVFAVKCVLTNLVCNSNSHCDVSYLHHLVNKRMSLNALSSWGVPQYNVIKCSSNGIDVISEIVRNGFATYKTQKPANAKSSKSGKHVKFQEVEKLSKPMNGSHYVKKSKGNLYVQNENYPSNEAIGTSHSQNFVTENGHVVAKNNVPKKIIKRGSDLSQIVKGSGSENKVKDNVNHLFKIDCVLSNLKLVNNVRQLVSLTSDDNLISSAVKFLLDGADVKANEDVMNDVKEAYREYNSVLDEIKNCTDQALLNDLKVKREAQKNDLCSKLATFLNTFDVSVLEKQKIIQKMITDLESNCNAWMNVYLPSKPASTEELFELYSKEKEKRCKDIEAARENTDAHHKKFMDFLGEFQKEFSLNSAGPTDIPQMVEGKKGSCALQFAETLSNLGTALEQEMKTCNVKKGNGYVSVIQCILDKIDISKEKIDTECETYEKYKSLHDDLMNMTDLKQVFHDLSEVQQEIQKLTSVVGDANSENGTDKDHFDLLHKVLLKEGALMEILTKASALHFPEIILERPELSLHEYQFNSYLMKHSWRKEFFPILEECARVEPSFKSKFGDQLVVIKEFVLEKDAQKVAFTNKVKIWNEIKSKFLVKVDALFNKDEKTICAMLPHVPLTLLENPLPVSTDRRTACDVLQKVLNGLKDIHSRGMAHGAVHPLAVLYDNEVFMLDFNYEFELPEEKFVINGINFRTPKGSEMTCKSADMYGFGCLVLLVLFPNLSFTSTEKGVPNLSAFQSILEELLIKKDLSSLVKLLDDNPDRRPSSKDLFSSGFLKDLRLIPDSGNSQ